MTDLQGELTTPTDAALISQTRLGNRRAFQALVDRHLPAVRLLAELLEPDADHEPLIDGILDTAYGTLRRMSGPTVSVRTFLLLLTRRLHALRRGSTPGRPFFTLEPAFSGVPFRDHRASERHDAVAARFAALPEGWQAAVWHVEAEREPAEAVASVLGVAPSGVRHLVLSARRELRSALIAHRPSALPPRCAAHTMRLARSRTAVPPRSVLRHAAGCERCVMLVDDLATVEHDLPGVLARHLLGPVADDYLDVRREGAPVTRARSV